jgi:hypothetical protein
VSRKKERIAREARRKEAKARNMMTPNMVNAVREQAQLGVDRLQHWMDNHADCLKKTAAIVVATDIATVMDLLAHPRDYGCGDKAWLQVEDGRKALGEQIRELLKTAENPAVAFREFLSAILALTIQLIGEIEDGAAHQHNQKLETFAAKIGERVHVGTDGSLHVCNGDTAGCVHALDHDPKHLVLGINCQNSYVANAVEDMVSGGLLSVIPEARTTLRGFTQIYFKFDPENPEAVRVVRQLKDQPGEAVQLPLQMTVETARVN